MNRAFIRWLCHVYAAFTYSCHVCTVFICPHHINMLNKAVTDQALTGLPLRFWPVNEGIALFEIEITIKPLTNILPWFVCYLDLTSNMLFDQKGAWQQNKHCYIIDNIIPALLLLCTQLANTTLVSHHFSFSAELPVVPFSVLPIHFLYTTSTFKVN